MVSSTVLKALVTLTLIAGTLAYPYPGEEQDDPMYEGQPEEYVRLVPLRRFPRATHRPAPQHRPREVLIPESQYHHPQQRNDLVPSPSLKEPIAAETGYGGGHSSNPYDYVDYGAYTGGYGAFGWYSDHPVQGGYR